jgi:hypothetical protein
VVSCSGLRSVWLGLTSFVSQLILTQVFVNLTNNSVRGSFNVVEINFVSSFGGRLFGVQSRASVRCSWRATDSAYHSAGPAYRHLVNHTACVAFVSYFRREVDSVDSSAGPALRYRFSWATCVSFWYIRTFLLTGWHIHVLSLLLRVFKVTRRSTWRNSVRCLYSPFFSLAFRISLMSWGLGDGGRLDSNSWVLRVKRWLRRRTVHIFLFHISFTRDVLILKILMGMIKLIKAQWRKVRSFTLFFR